MDEILSPNEQLDKYLIFFGTLEHPVHTAFLYKGLHHLLEISDLKKWLIVERLIKDGYLVGDLASNGNGYFYSISFDGQRFIESGGYVAKALKDANDALLVQMEIDRRRTLDVLLATNSTRLNVLTWWLVIGAFAVVLWQVFLYFYPVHKDYPYWIWETIPQKKL